MKPESKKAQKAREIAERKAAKEAEKQAERDRVFATPLAKAVAPLKVQAVANAEIRANEWVEKRFAELEAAGWNINEVAPAPNSLKEGRETYRAKQARRNAYESITKYERPEGVYNDQTWRDMSLPRIVQRHQAGIDRYVQFCRGMAASQYEAFVYKMVGKVGDHTAAELLDNNVWGYSHLLVTKADGSTEKWRTQTIINVSVYGKQFNQWPSRIVK